MSNKCGICGKGTISGHNVPRKGVAKKKGGFRRYIVNRTKRTFKPNIVKIRIQDGKSVHPIKICTRCLRANVVKKVV